jgi:hypothetical protein
MFCDMVFILVRPNHCIKQMGVFIFNPSFIFRSLCYAHKEVLFESTKVEQTNVIIPFFDI